MNAFLFFRYGIRMYFFQFSQRVQILETEYKYGQYCTPLSQSDCRYFFRVSDNYRYIPSRMGKCQHFNHLHWLSSMVHKIKWLKRINRNFTSFASLVVVSFNIRENIKCRHLTNSAINGCEKYPKRKLQNQCSSFYRVKLYIGSLSLNL